MVWNPADYAANSGSQLVWARELIARLELRGDERILDVGCGDGKVTAELARAVPEGEVVGVDSSGEMVRFARRRFPAATHPNLRFRRMDARQLRFAEPFDVIFSNATLHWVDDHPAFLRGAARGLRVGGRLAISCGGKGNAHDVFVALRAVMRAGRFRRFFRRMALPYFFYTPEAYAKWLPRYGFAARTIRLAERPTRLDGPAALAAWFRTTWLPYTQRVPETMRGDFVDAVVDRYLARHPPASDGQLTIRMVRLQIEAEKSGAVTT